MGATQSRAASPPHRKEPSEAVTSWVRDCIYRMAWEPLDVFPDKLEEVGRGSSVLPCFACCPRDLTSDKIRKMTG